VKCVNDGCICRVHAFKGKWKLNWKCSIVIEHTCLLSEVLPSHRNISYDFVAKQMYESPSFVDQERRRPVLQPHA